MRSLGKTRRTPATTCVGCGREITAATPIDCDEKPKSGDATVCLYCGHLMIYSDDFSLRNPTDEEMREMAGDPRVVGFNKLRGKP